MITKTWGGVPLYWASDLFIGRFPCPDSKAAIQLHLESADSLVIESDSQKFIYTFTEKNGYPWPVALHWSSIGKKDSEKLGEGNDVDFIFDEPDLKTLSPLKWEARSTQGKVKARWKHRDILI